MAGGELMINLVETYLAVRRVAGFALSNTQYLLRSFAKFAGDRQEAHVRVATAIDWASETVSVAQRHTRYETVRLFARYVRLEDARHESLLPNHFGYRKTRRVPHIYSRVEINRLILEASQLRPPDSSHTYAALISLLVATGLRISEALGLLISDMTPNGLLIRKTKFQKTRLVPLHETAVVGLRCYLTQHRRMHSGGDHLFLSNNGRPLRYVEVHGMFRKLIKAANLLPSHGRAPRLHDFRHYAESRIMPSRCFISAQSLDSACMGLGIIRGFSERPTTGHPVGSGPDPL
jgi:site-specific recombinase XerD